MRTLGALLIFSTSVTAWCGSMPQVFTFSTGVAEVCIRDSSPAGVTCSALGGSANVELASNPTLLPGVVTFITSGNSSFTYTQADSNLGYLVLEWSGALSQPAYPGTVMPFQYSFTLTENETQPLLWNTSFGPTGIIDSYPQAYRSDGGSSIVITGQGNAFSQHTNDAELVNLELGIQFANQFTGVVPTPDDVPSGDEFTLSDVSVSIEVPSVLFVPEPASWILMFAIVPISILPMLRRRRRGGTGTHRA
jgi:hypothetical protein